MFARVKAHLDGPSLGRTQISHIGEELAQFVCFQQGMHSEILLITASKMKSK